MSATQIPLDLKPEIAQAIGRLVGHWAIVESHIEMLFSVMLDLGQFRARLIFQNFNECQNCLSIFSSLFSAGCKQAAQLIHENGC